MHIWARRMTSQVRQVQLAVQPCQTVTVCVVFDIEMIQKAAVVYDHSPGVFGVSGNDKQSPIFECISRINAEDQVTADWLTEFATSIPRLDFVTLTTRAVCHWYGDRGNILVGSSDRHHVCTST